MLASELFDNIIQQLITIGSSVGGSFLMLLCLNPSASFAVTTLAKLSSGIAFFYYGIGLHNQLRGRIIKKNKQISDEIEKFEIRVRYIIVI